MSIINPIKHPKLTISMKRAILIILGVVIGALLLFTGVNLAMATYQEWRYSVEKEREASEIEAMLHPDTRMILFSLDPQRGNVVNADRVFHDFRILGEVEVKDPEERAKLIAGLASDVRTSSRVASFCFMPRHGLRLISQSEITDFSIYFECLKVFVYRDSEAPAGLVIDDKSAPEFNAYLDKHAIPRAPKDR